MNIHAPKFAETKIIDSEAKREIHNRIASQLLLRYLQKHHYEYAPESYKSRFLPVPIRDDFRVAFEAAKARNAVAAELELQETVRAAAAKAATAGPVSIKIIIAYVAMVYDVATIDLIGPRRNPKFVRARQIGFWLARKLATNRSLAEIGNQFGRDHTTVLHGIGAVDRQRSIDPDFAAQTDRDRVKIRDLSKLAEERVVA